jgi:hypothetical protein
MISFASANLVQRFANAADRPLQPLRPPDDPGKRQAILRPPRRTRRSLELVEAKPYAGRAAFLVYDVIR